MVAVTHCHVFIIIIIFVTVFLLFCFLIVVFGIRHTAWPFLHYVFVMITFSVVIIFVTVVIAAQNEGCRCPAL